MKTTQRHTLGVLATLALGRGGCAGMSAQDDHRRGVGQERGSGSWRLRAAKGERLRSPASERASHWQGVRHGVAGCGGRQQSQPS